jgi:hypothetical protein
MEALAEPVAEPVGCFWCSMPSATACRSSASAVWTTAVATAARPAPSVIPSTEDRSSLRMLDRYIDAVNGSDRALAELMRTDIPGHHAAASDGLRWAGLAEAALRARLQVCGVRRVAPPADRREPPASRGVGCLLEEMESSSVPFWDPTRGSTFQGRGHGRYADREQYSTSFRGRPYRGRGDSCAHLVVGGGCPSWR